MSIWIVDDFVVKTYSKIQRRNKTRHKNKSIRSIKWRFLEFVVRLWTFKKYR